METSQKIFVAIGTVAVVGLAIVGGKVLMSDSPGAASGTVASNSSQLQTSSATNSSSAATTSDTTATTAASYKDGQYTATQSYAVPHGSSNSITVTLTVANGKISAVKTENQTADRESETYISDFESSVDSSASGQLLSGYSPSRIGGASLTTQAFTAAIDTIKSQAAA